jgi:hypothetical protein
VSIYYAIYLQQTATSVTDRFVQLNYILGDNFKFKFRSGAIFMRGRTTRANLLLKIIFNVLLK